MVPDDRGEPGAASVGQTLRMLTLQVIDPQVYTPGTDAIAQSPLGLRLDGTGLSVWLDGQVIGAQLGPGEDTRAFISMLRRARPRIRTATLELGDQLQFRQIAALLKTLMGQSTPLLDAVGLSVTPWATGETPEMSSAVRERSERLRRQAALFVDRPVQLSQPYPLRKEDQVRLQRLGETMAQCLPLLDTPPRRDLTLELQFKDGHVVGSRVSSGNETAAKCLQETAGRFRLRGHQEAITIHMTWRAIWFKETESS